LALAHRVRERRDQLFARLAGEWLGAQRRGVRAECHAVARSLGATPEAPATQRFALRAWPPAPEGARLVEVEEAVVRLGAVELRLRRRSAPDGEQGSVRLAADGCELAEGEAELPAPLFAALWSLTMGQPTRGRELHVVDGEVTWELHDGPAPQAVARWPHAAAAPAPPAWLAPFIDA
jgi:hypothetical protein